MITFLIILGYIAIGAITGGYLQHLHEDEYDWRDHVFSVALGTIWPATWFYFSFIRPIAKLGKHLAEVQKIRQERKRRIRVQLEADAIIKRREEEEALRLLEAEQAGEAALKRAVGRRRPFDE